MHTYERVGIRSLKYCTFISVSSENMKNARKILNMIMFFLFFQHLCHEFNVKWFSRLLSYEYFILIFETQTEIHKLVCTF